MTGLRDVLRGRPVPEPEVVGLPLDGNAYAAAERALEIEQRTRRAMELSGIENLAEQDARVAAAEAALAAVPTFTVRLRQVPAEEYDLLVEKHPPTDEQRKQGLPWNKPRFRAALLAACVVRDEGEPEVTEEDWTVLAREQRVAAGELELLFATAVNAHLRQPQVSTGKG